MKIKLSLVLKMNIRAVGLLALIVFYSIDLHGQYVRFDNRSLMGEQDTTSIFSGKYSSNLSRILYLTSWVEDNRSGCPDAVYFQRLDSIYNTLKSYTTKNVNYALLSRQIDELSYRASSAYKDYYERASPYGIMKQELALKKQDKIDSLLLEGIRLRENEQYESALELFNKVIDLDSTRLNNYYFAIDNVLSVSPDTAKVLYYLDKLVRINKENKKLNFSPSYAYMYFYFEKQQYAKALDYANNAIETGSDDYKAMLTKARIYKLLKDYPNSNSSFEEFLRCIQHQPFVSSFDSAFVYNNIAWNYYLMKEYKLCVEYADLSLKLNPNSSYTIDTRASGFYGLGEYQKCINETTKALRLSPEMENSWHLRGLSYKQLNMVDKACSDLSMAANLGVEAALEDMTDYCRKETVERTLNQYKFQESKSKKTNRGIVMDRFGYIYFLLN